MGPAHEGSIRRPIAPWANALPLSYVPLPQVWERLFKFTCGADDGAQQLGVDVGVVTVDDAEHLAPGSLAHRAVHRDKHRTVLQESQYMKERRSEGRMDGRKEGRKDMFYLTKHSTQLTEH